MPVGCPCLPSRFLHLCVHHAGQSTKSEKFRLYKRSVLQAALKVALGPLMEASKE